MQDQKWHEIRLRFSKTGRAKYIGHLDVNRVMSRALRRAGIPLWFTEGYNPTLICAFRCLCPWGWRVPARVWIFD